jgi:hypothetical protein
VFDKKKGKFFLANVKHLGLSLKELWDSTNLKSSWATSLYLAGAAVTLYLGYKMASKVLLIGRAAYDPQYRRDLAPNPWLQNVRES